MNTSTFIENLRTSNLYTINDVRTSQFSLNSLGNYVYQVLNSSTIQNYANLTTPNLFLYPPQTNTAPTLANHFTTKIYVDDKVTSIDSDNHQWSGNHFFQNPLNLLDGLYSNASSLNASSPYKIGYTYYSQPTEPILLDTSMNILTTIPLNLAGVWQVHTQFEYTGEGILTQFIAGYDNDILYTEDSTIAIEPGDKVQRFVPCVFVNPDGNSSLTILSSGKTMSGTIYCSCKYFYVRIA